MTNYLFNDSKKMQWSLLLGDMALILTSILVTCAVMNLHNSDSDVFGNTFYFIIPMWVVVVGVYTLLAYIYDQYSPNRIVMISKNAGMLLHGLIPWGIVISILVILFPENVVNKKITVICFFSTSVLLLLWRWIAVNIMKNSVIKKHLAIVGYKKNIVLLCDELSRLSHTDIEVNRVYIIDAEEMSNTPLARSVIVQKDLSALLSEREFDVLALDSSNGHFSHDQLRNILQLQNEGKIVRDLASLYENLTGKIPISAIDPQWLLQNPEFQCAGGRFYRSVKRILDVILASCFLVVVSPLLLLIAVVVKLESKGAALFVQERLGVHKKPFRCYKFRTMVENAESESGPVWATGNDPRITRVGRILRKSRLDELPQLWNILKGEMSFVGPRPIREHFANRLAQHIPFYGLRFFVKPGLTGWAQVNYGYAGSDEGQMEKFQYDLFYILNKSLKLDFLAMFKTCKTVVKRAGV